MGLTTQGGKGCVNKKDSLHAADSLTWSQFSLRKTIGSSEEHARNRPQQLCAIVQLELTTATSVQNLQVRARMKQVFVLFPRKTDGHLSGETCRPSLTVATTGLSPAPDDKDRKLRGYTSRTSCMHDDSIDRLCARSFSSRAPPADYKYGRIPGRRSNQGTPALATPHRLRDCVSCWFVLCSCFAASYRPWRRRSPFLP